MAGVMAVTKVGEIQEINAKPSSIGILQNQLVPISLDSASSLGLYSFYTHYQSCPLLCQNL